MNEVHLHLQSDSLSLDHVHPLIRAFGPRDLHHEKGRGQGGVAETGFFPPGSNPSDGSYKSITDWLPLKSLPIATGSAILFNTNLVHAATSKIAPNQPRRLITYLFCANPVDPSENHYCRLNKDNTLSNNELLGEIWHLEAMTYPRTNVCSYGEAIDRYPAFLRRHGLNFDKIISRVESMKMSGSGLTKESRMLSNMQMNEMSSFLTANFKFIEN